jgi:hypothetical protein
MSEAEILDQYLPRLIATGWVSEPEAKWVMRRTGRMAGSSIRVPLTCFMTGAHGDDNPITTRSESMAPVTQNEVAEAAAVDAKVQEILRAARARGPAGPIAAPESTRDGDECMEQMPCRRRALLPSRRST